MRRGEIFLRRRSAACRRTFEKREKTNREEPAKAPGAAKRRKNSRSRRFPAAAAAVPGRRGHPVSRGERRARDNALWHRARGWAGRAGGARGAPSGAYHVDVAGEQARVHPELAHATRDELRVLRAIVQDHDGIGSGDGPGLASGLLGGVGRHGVADVCVRRGDARASLSADAARRRFSHVRRRAETFSNPRSREPAISAEMSARRTSRFFTKMLRYK